MEEFSSSETLLNTYLTTRRRNPEHDTQKHPSPVAGVHLIRLRYHIFHSCLSACQSEEEEPNGLTLGNLMLN